MTFLPKQVLFLPEDTVYGADELGLPYRDIIREGVVVPASGSGSWSSAGLHVTERAAGANMSVDVSAGACWIQGDDDVNDLQPTYRYREAASNLTITAADPTNPRKDLVIAEILDSTFSGVSNLGRLRVVAGTPAGVPSPPALPSNAIPLAIVAVPANDTAITDSQITDMRRPAFAGKPYQMTTTAFATLTAAAAIDDDGWDGLEVEVTFGSGFGNFWRFKYNEASSSKKWKFLGGDPLYAEVLTAETRANSAYGALTTAGPSIDIPLAGDYLVELGARMSSGGLLSENYMSYDIEGTGAVDADALEIDTVSSTGKISGARTMRKSDLAMDDSLVAKYRNTNGTTTFANRYMRVTPIRLA